MNLLYTKDSVKKSLSPHITRSSFWTTGMAYSSNEKGTSVRPASWVSHLLTAFSS